MDRNTTQEFSEFPTVLSLRDAAGICGLSPSTLWRRIQEGHLPAIRLPGCKKLSVLATDLQKYIENSEEITSGSAPKRADEMVTRLPGLQDGRKTEIKITPASFMKRHR